MSTKFIVPVTLWAAIFRDICPEDLIFHTTPYFKRWASEGPLYADYALYLIRKYPIQFAENFMLPNSVKYAIPPTEFLGTYNMGGDSVGKLAMDWFNYKSQKVKDHNKKGGTIAVVEWYPIFCTLVNVLLLISLAGMFVFNGFKEKTRGLPKIALLIIVFWVANAGFSIFASPVVLRYQAFPVLVSFCVAVIFVESIYKLAVQEELSKKMKLA